jgi:hypothetical protein
MPLGRSMIDVNLLVDNTNTMEKNALTDISKEAGLEVNIEKTEYTFLSRHRMQGKIVA